MSSGPVATRHEPGVPADAVRIIDALARRARRHDVACGEGVLVLREWGDGPALVLLHGGFGSWLHWVRNIDALAASRRVIAVDLPGLGDSTCMPEPVTPEAIGARVAGAIDHCLAAEPGVDLVGFSFGGLVAGQVAACLGARARSLILVGASGLGLPRQRYELVRRTPQMDARALRAAQAQNVRTLMLHDPDSLDELALAVQAHNDARARLKSRRMSLGDSLRHVLPRVHARLSGIWGEYDITAVPWIDERRALLESLHPELEFRVLPDAGHWVQYEASDAFNRLLPRLLAA
jgi:pimeloyl-ACP methyl ester carboxylesterase